MKSDIPRIISKVILITWFFGHTVECIESNQISKYAIGIIFLEYTRYIMSIDKFITTHPQCSLCMERNQLNNSSLINL